ncbi:hypothetical protein FraQA3DRAFT_3130 [Frankia sp. QA3]|nr:hypothetical protein FraQA3DRAFT_3130 [Frankia sp. QA3]
MVPAVDTDDRHHLPDPDERQAHPAAGVSPAR